MKRLQLVIFSFVVATTEGCSSPPPPKPVLRTLTNSIGMSLVLIPEGSFQMGYPNGSFGADHIHKVTVSSFWMGQYEVTNAQFKLFKSIKQFPQFAGATQPASSVRWVDARDFCKWLSNLEGVKYRLPTEAEWEYAARGGLEQKEFPWGNEDPEGRANTGNVVTVPIGSYAPNNFDLYDMAGNVDEHVSDYFNEAYYKVSPTKDPQGPKRTDRDWIKKSGTDWRISRGGNFATLDIECGNRAPRAMDEKNPVMSGFRVVMEDSPLATK